MSDADKDDDFQNAENLDTEEALKERIEAEILRVNGPADEKGIRADGKLPDKYVGFTIRYKCFWIWLNLFNIATSIAMAVGGALILSQDQDQSTLSYQ